MQESPDDRAFADAPDGKAVLRKAGADLLDMWENDRSKVRFAPTPHGRSRPRCSCFLSDSLAQLAQPGRARRASAVARTEASQASQRA